MDKRLKEKLKQAFSPPNPTKKNAFLKTIRPREISMLEMILGQFFYLRKTVLAFVVLGIIVAGLGVSTLNRNTLLIIETLSPLAAGLACLEMYRSYRYGMSELELATRFSLKSVFFARMLLIGLIYLIAFAIIIPIISMRFGSLVSISFRVLVPYLITASVCLHLERSRLGRKKQHLSMVVACLISVSVLFFRSYGISPVASNFTQDSTQWKILVLACLLVITIYENYKTINMMEDYVCR